MVRRRMKKKILAVDDDVDNNYSLKIRLEDSYSEYEVIGVDSGEKCFEFLKNNEIPDVILLDIMMPNLNGWEIYQKLKENSTWKNIPVIFVTASTGDLSDKVKDRVGSDGVIEKPYDIEILMNRINEVLEKPDQKQYF